MDVTGRLLQELDRQYVGLFDWLSGQFDPVTGGFYYARSSIGARTFAPDIESTAQAINILKRQQLLDEMPDPIRESIVKFFQRKQDQGSGYFFDEHPAMAKDEVMVQRALNYSIGSLKRLGATPLYDLPKATNEWPSFTKSVTAYRQEWERISLQNSWRGCDRLVSSAGYIHHMEPEQQKRYVQSFVDYLAEIQDPTTGLWGEGSLYVKISGTFKLHTFYRKYQMRMPNQEKIYQSIMRCLHEEEATDMCYVRNPIDLLSYLEVEIPREYRHQICKVTIENLQSFKQSDGGFSREIDRSPKAPNVSQVKAGEHYPEMPRPVELGLGLREGDMNASTQATLIRQQLYHLLQTESVHSCARHNFGID
ncbi:hypothetical protein J416_10391 [Gracilibacillus halophilus YIM-C55.5]|uniref:Uncharacterized protein n=1 Tax=Gracilibacillus halophilus YIM-C55.5 TaxID=1308866 RepID=N4W8A2_9BACI|nr:hypothetical protein [Gracilibacillus halophilus]ENH96498.1 hypothetical protein J416_10391 [Gracilibacillus halophilus YIM-C55.5]